MFSLAELARVHSTIGEDDIEHLQRLVAGWALLSDLSFSDLLLVVPERDGGLVVLGQVRPSTSRTVNHTDLVGRTLPRVERPLVERALVDGYVATGEEGGPDEPRRVVAVPVRRAGTVVAVLVAESPSEGGRRVGGLEKAYLGVFDRFVTMIAAGSFPYPHGDVPIDAGPRVGDGVLVLDREGRVTYGSPNANSALHRLGVLAQVEGRTLAQLGLDDAVVRGATTSARPQATELTRGMNTHVEVHCLPLLDDGGPGGSLLLVRDVSAVRRLDRLLVSKDTYIREIHHRVKNNLQTISSLLRLQARRVSSPEARAAIEDSVRRIASIAVVHETLALEAGDDVSFGEIARPIVRMAEESVTSPVLFRLDADPVALPAEIATPLALVLTELVQNAVAHGYPAGAAKGTVEITLRVHPERLTLTVRDDGVGLDASAMTPRSTGLGLSIIRALVEGELCGTLALGGRTDGQPGAEALVDVPVTRPTA
ncbi:MAG: ATPase [Actinobacteria bacterium]|nr:ATPase [Actinomycetota bacterium]